MRIIVAKDAGFCFGVKRAIETLEKEASKGESIYTLGEVIHNPQTVKRLVEKGVIPVESINDARGKIAIPSHGGEKKTVEELKKKGIEFLDVTCPYVTKIQRYVEKLSEEGFFIVMVGDEDHPEVRSSVSYSQGPCRVIWGAEEISDLHPGTKLAVLAQTTLNLEYFQKVVSDLIAMFEKVYVLNTICEATRERQAEAKRLAEICDCVIVVGGRKSANTRRLYEISREIQPSTYHVESPEELSAEWFAGVDTVGVIGGASTPDWLIDEVVEKIKSFEREVAHGGRKI